ncbi:DUF58 domain-containing protein [bacterium]|nr:DUF58 domain-containing protein [bacterium]
MLSKELLQKVRQIQIRTSHQVTEVMAGEYKSAFKGRGMEFDEVRLYQPGDDIRTIDWNVTARTGTPYVKRFVEERELTVMLMVDASSSGTFGSQDKSKNEIAAEIAGLLAYTAIRSNDRVGLIIFTDKIELYIPPKKGHSHVLRVIREVLGFKKEERSSTNVGAALDFLGKVCRRKAVVFLISDFLCENFEKPIKLASRRHDLIPVSVSDPRENSLPPVGLITLEDAETGETITVDTYDSKVRSTLEKLSAIRSEEREHNFTQSGVDTMRVSTASNYCDELVRFFKRREKSIF